MYVIEFQKRGLPHVHMLIWIDSKSKPRTVAEIDKIICAEIPNRRIDPLGYHLVTQHMIHGPCGSDRPSSPCMARGKCTRHFPKR